MKRALILLMPLVLVPALSATAQNWSEEQQEVIHSLEACWTTWEDAVDQDDIDIWIDQCTDGDYAYWGSAQGAPNSPQTARREFDWIKEQGFKWTDIRPLTVKVIGNVAVMHFYGYWTRNSPDGLVAEEDKRTEVFHKVDGRWLLVAGHATPAN